MYRIAISDDDKDFLDLLERRVQQYCEKRGLSIELRAFYDGEILLDQTEHERLFDAYLLDIEMGCHSGIDIAKCIKKHSDMPLILFLTAFSEYAVEVCRMDIFWYLCKEKLEEELEKALDELFARLCQRDNDKTYIINNNRKYFRISYKEIIYIYKNQKNVVFVLTGKRFIQERITLQEVYKKLDSYEMVMLDRGVILNLSHIRQIMDGEIKMDEENVITSNSAHVVEIKRLLMNYWGDMI